MKKYKLTVLALSLILILISIGLISYNIFFFKEVKVLNMHFQTSEKMGVNVDGGALFFGKAYPGSTTTRVINLTNYYEFPLHVSIKILGEMKPITSVSDNEFNLKPNEKKQITYYVKTDSEEIFRNFTGQTQIVFNRALFN